MILLHSAGNSRIGLGNLSRISAIAIALKEKVKDIVLIYECSSEIAQNYKVQGVKTYVVSSREEAKEVIKTLKLNNSIVVSDLIDMNYEDNIFYKEVGFKKLIQINDSNVHIVKPDVYINSDAFYREFNLEKDIKIYSGKDFISVNKKILNLRPKRVEKIVHIKKILICFGGADPANYTEVIIDDIENNRLLDKYNFEIVLGCAFSQKRIDNIMKKQKDNIKYIINEKNMGLRILNNDFIVTLGGLTTYEAMVLGKPVGAVPWKYMEYYVNNLSSSGYIVEINKKNNKLMLLEAIDNLHILNKVRDKAFTEVTGRGIDNIVDVILRECAFYGE